MYKATFDIELEVDANLVALSNQPIKSETESKPGKKLYKYEQTPIMSSYLIAFAVGEFEYIEVSDFSFVFWILEKKKSWGKDLTDLAVLGQVYMV